PRSDLPATPAATLPAVGVRRIARAPGGGVCAAGTGVVAKSADDQRCAGGYWDRCQYWVAMRIIRIGAPARAILPQPTAQCWRNSLPRMEPRHVRCHRLAQLDCR